MTTEVSTDIRPLSPVEQNMLTEYKRIIEAGMKSFIQVGNALLQIQERKLYRLDAEGNKQTFAEFMKREFDLSERRGYQFIDAAKVHEEICTSVQNPPATEFAMRELVDVPEDRTVEVAERAAEIAGGSPSSTDIKKAKKELLDPEPQTEDEKFESMLNDVDSPTDDLENSIEIAASAIKLAINDMNALMRTIKEIPVQRGCELFDSRRKDFITDLTIIKGGLQSVMPVGICPDCEGACDGCVKCGNAGYVTKLSK